MLYVKRFSSSDAKIHVISQPSNISKLVDYLLSYTICIIAIVFLLSIVDGFVSFIRSGDRTTIAIKSGACAAMTGECTILSILWLRNKYGRAIRKWTQYHLIWIQYYLIWALFCLLWMQEFFRLDAGQYRRIR